MEVLLIRPPATYPQGAILPQAGIPVGLLFIGAMLEEYGLTVKIIDAQINPYAPLSEADDGSKHLGLSWDEVETELNQSNACLVGISAIFSAQFNNAIKCAELVRILLPEAIIAMGGNHVTARPDDCFSLTNAVDIVCLGEGEQTMSDIARAVQGGNDITAIEGTVVRKDNKTIVNPPRKLLIDLDQLPLPAYHLINLEDYFEMYAKGFNDRITKHYPGSERAVSVITSRGCPFKCVFCSIHLHMGRKWRSHSVEYVQKHLELLVSKYKVRHIHFEDDNISASQNRFIKLLNMVRDSGYGLTWDTPNGVRVDTLTKEIIHLCKESGCAYLVFGVESGNTRVLKEVIDKELDLNAVIAASKWCQDVGLQTMAFYIIGFPGEEIDEIHDTMKFALGLMKSYDVIPHLIVATPLPGTKLESICLELGLLKKVLEPNEFAVMTLGNFLIDTDKVTSKEIARELSRFRRLFKQVFIRNSLLFFVKHPLTIFKFLKEVFWYAKKLPLQKAVYRVLEFKNSLR